MIEPKLLKGFRDFLPEAELKKLELQKKLEAVFRSMGFAPIDTPALEYAEVLFGKGGGETDKQGYRFTDAGGREVALRFNLTVPFARFCALHLGELPLPFKRYHIAKVWRGENTQKGRYREFMQCDFDIIGTESAASDFEILLTMRKALYAVTGGGITIRVNHRGLFNRFTAKLGAAEKSQEILRAVDKLSKIGESGVTEILTGILDESRARAVMEFIKPRSSWRDTLDAMTELAGGGCRETERLSELRLYMEETGIARSFTLDPSIARGLDYYTGIVYESFLDGCPEIGSVCSGGRYDNLAGLYTKERLPGVGSSVGLDRLIAALEETGRTGGAASFAKTAIVCVKTEDAGKYQSAAEVLRESGISCDVFLEPDKPARQFQAAEKKGIPFALVPEDGGLWTLRELSARSDKKALSLEAVIKSLTEF